MRKIGHAIMQRTTTAREGGKERMKEEEGLIKQSRRRRDGIQCCDHCALWISLNFKVFFSQVSTCFKLQLRFNEAETIGRYLNSWVHRISITSNERASFITNWKLVPQCAWNDDADAMTANISHGRGPVPELVLPTDWILSSLDLDCVLYMRTRAGAGGGMRDLLWRVSSCSGGSSQGIQRRIFPLMPRGSLCTVLFHFSSYPLE